MLPEIGRASCRESEQRAVVGDQQRLGFVHVGHRVGARQGFFFQAEDGIRAGRVTGVQTCALPILTRHYRLPKAYALSVLSIVASYPAPAPVALLSRLGGA